MSHLRWPLILVAASLLLGAGVSVASSGTLDWLAGVLAGVGSVTIGAWLGSMTWAEDARRNREREKEER